MSTYEGRWTTVDVKVEEGIAWVMFNRPDKRNAMSPTLNAEMLQVLDAIELDATAKVLVLTGHLTPHARSEFERMGQRHFVRKPYTLDELGRNLRALLASHHGDAARGAIVVIGTSGRVRCLVWTRLWPSGLLVGVADGLRVQLCLGQRGRH